MKNIYKFLYINIFLLLFLECGYCQPFFSKLIKLKPDTAQIFTAAYIYKDSVYTYVNFKKFGINSSAFAVFDTSLNLNRTLDFPKLMTQTNGSYSYENGILYKSGIELNSNLEITDSQIVTSYNTKNKTFITKRNWETGDIGDEFSDRLFTYKDTTYAYSTFGYTNNQNLQKLKINILDKEMNLVGTKFINYKTQVSISQIIRNDKYMYLLGIMDTIINQEAVKVYNLKKLDIYFNTIWVKNYATHDWGPAIAGTMCNYGDDIVMVIYTDRLILNHEINMTNPVVYRIDPDGNVKWKVDFLNRFESGAHTIKPMKNGDIMLCGLKSTLEANGSPGWLVRMTSSGEILWNKTYLDKRAANSIFGYLYDFHELPGGNILGFGAFQQVDTSEDGQIKEFTSAWALKLGPDGCPGFDCGDVVLDYTLKGRDPITIDLLNIYPNPTSGLIYGDGANIYEDRTLTILNLTGKIVYEGKTKDLLSGIDINNLPPGVYFISVRGSQVKKIIKLWH